MESFKVESSALQYSRNSSVVDDDDDRSAGEPGRKNRGMKRAATPADVKAGISRRKLRKNDREKQRRFELNNRFEVMSNILNLGQSNKTEKFTILSEAINMISALRAQNEHLRTEKANLRAELAKVTCCLQQAQFPGSRPPILPPTTSELVSAPFDFTQVPFTASLPGAPNMTYPGGAGNNSRSLPFVGGITLGPTTGNMEEDFDIFSS